MSGRKSKYEVLIDFGNLALRTLLTLARWIFGFAFDGHIDQVGLGAANAWATGLLISVAAALAIVQFSEWQKWISALTGLWVTVSPWILGFAEDLYACWISVTVGLAVVSLAGIELNMVEQRSQTRADIERELRHLKGKSPSGPRVFGQLITMRAKIWIDRRP